MISLYCVPVFTFAFGAVPKIASLINAAQGTLIAGQCHLILYKKYARLSQRT